MKKNTIKGALCGMLLLGGLVVGASATGNDYVIQFGNQVVPDVNTVGSVTVAPTDAIRAWFKANHIDPAIIDAPLGTLSKADKDAMDTLFANSDNLTALNALIQPVLQKALVRGSVENAQMRLGRRMWTESIYGDEDR